MALVKLYHVTTAEAARKILAEGFREAPTEWNELAGVFFSLVPLSLQEGCKGETALEIALETTAAELFYEWEVVEELKHFREFLIPTYRVNGCPIRILTPDEVSAVVEAGGWNEYPPGEPDATFRRLSESDPS